LEKNSLKHIGSLVNDGFEIDNVLAKLSSKLFDIDKESRTILGVIAREGLITEYQITKQGFKLYHEITREKVRRRLLVTELTEGYVIQRRGKRHRNIRKRKVITKPYALTLKGLIASLAITSFDDNYMVKKYFDFFKGWINKFNISELAIQVIKYNLALFMIKNVVEGSNFTTLKNIEPQIFTLNEGDPLLDPTFPQAPIHDKKYEEWMKKIRYRFHVVQQLFIKARRQVTKSPFKRAKILDDDFHLLKFKNKEAYFGSNILPTYVTEWYGNIDRVQFENLDEFNPNIIPELENQEGTEISIVSVNTRAKQILKKLKIKEKLYYHDLPTIFY